MTTLPSDLRPRIEAIKAQMPDRWRHYPSEGQPIYADGAWTEGKRPADWQEREKPRDCAAEPVRPHRNIMPTGPSERKRSVMDKRPSRPRPKTLRASWTGNPTLTIEAIVSRQRAGMNLVQIGVDLGVSGDSVNQRLIHERRVNPEYWALDVKMRLCACGGAKLAHMATCNRCKLGRKAKAASA